MADSRTAAERGANPRSEPVRLAKTDRVFAEKGPPGDFRFTAQVADVFDDMVGRSVPFYDEMQRMTAELVAEFAQPGTNVYDLGCSTGTTLAALDAVVADGVRLVGIDNSQPMLDQARAKLAAPGRNRPFELVFADLHDRPIIENASAVIMTLTLQFIRPLHRERIIRHIFEGMNDQGCLIIFEKLILPDSMLNRLFIKFYYEMKRRNGYSDVEIVQKREALENVLIPYRPEENVQLLKDAGFRRVDEFFRWYNFCGILAVK
jgi:tRNA (cmo5U34)-methyltransferase